MKKRIIISLFCIAVIGGSFYGGFWYGKQGRPSIDKVSGIQNLEAGKPADVDFAIFWDAWAKVQEKYVNREKLDYQEMTYGAISGMLASLGDPYTVFMKPVENKAFTQSMQGNLEGIGAEVGSRKGVITIVSPLENSPAEKAGLKAGDQIIKIDGVSTEKMSADEAVSKIRGDKGTEVTLAIFREGWTATQDFKIKRDVINVPISKFELKDGSGGKKIAYFALYQFTDNSVAEFEKAAQKILTSDAKGIILDFRGNPGGYLEAAVEMAGWFTEKDALIVTEDYGDGKKIEHRSDGINKLGSYDVVVLIDQGSASASEIFSGAMRDDKQYKLVGKKSFGKGSVQELEQMRGSTSIKITVAKWLTPSGHCIMEEGIMPDYEVDYVPNDEGKDAQLDKALELFK